MKSKIQLNHEHQINYCEKRFKFEYFVTEQVCDSQKNYLWIIKKKKTIISIKERRYQEGMMM